MAEGTRPYRITVLISGNGSNLQAILDATASDRSLRDCKVTAVISSRSDAYGLTRARATRPVPTPAEAFPLLRWKKLAGNEDKSRPDWERQLAAKITATRPDLVVLAGWMLILGPDFLKQLVRNWDEQDDAGNRDDRGAAEGTPCVDPTGERVGAGLATPGRSPYAVPSPSSLRGRPIPIINLHPALPGQFPGAHAIKDAHDSFLAGHISETGLMIHRVIPELDAGEPVVVRTVPIRAGDSLQQLEDRIHSVEHEAIVDAVRKVVDLCRTGEWWNATGATPAAATPTERADLTGEDRNTL
ncbi:hypothetical protein JCM3774_005052 [Rhodotorula dairenensis]